MPPTRTPIRGRRAPVAPPARLSVAELPPLDPATGLWPGEPVSLCGTDIFVRSTPPEAPDAEPALFVHGLGGASINWTDLAGQLRRHLAVEAIDLPGFGRSGPAADRDYSLRAHAQTVIAYLEHTARGPVHLIGNSMGGAVSILVAASRPDLVRTLTLISPAVPDVRLRVHPLRSDPRMALLVLPVLGSVAMRKGMEVPVEQQVDTTLGLCFADRTRYPRERLIEALSEARDRRAMPWAGDAFLRSLRGLARSQFAQGRRAWALMRTIEVPTLVIWGDRDRLVAPDLAPSVAAAIPDSRLLVLQDVGHTAMMEDPVTSARAVLGLVEDVAAAPG